MSDRSSRGATLGLLIVVVIAGLIWALSRDSVGPEPPHPLVERPAPVTEDSESSVVLTASSEERPDSARSRTEVPQAREDASTTSYWTLEFVGEGHAPLTEVEASLVLQAGPSTRRVEWASGSDSPGGHRWEIAVVEEEWATVEAWAPGFVPVAEPRRVRPGETDAIELKPGACVLGRVVDSFGIPVAGADVLLMEDGESDRASVRRRRRAVAGEDGRFRLGTTAHGLFDVVAERAPVGRSEPVSLELPSRGRADVGDLVLLGTGEIFGRVVLVGDLPAPEVGIRARLVEGDSRPGLRRASLLTDDRGGFRFGGLAEGEWQLEHDLRPVPEFGDLGRVRTGEGEVVLLLEAVRLSIRAEDAEGGTVGIIHISVTDLGSGRQPGSTHYGDPQDIFTLYLPPGRRYRMAAEDLEGSNYQAEVELVADEVERQVVLRPPPDFSASLRFAFFGPDDALLTDFVVVLVEEGRIDTTRLYAPRNFDDGVFTGLKPGTYTLEARPSGLRFWESDLITLRATPDVRLTAGLVSYAEATAAHGGRVELDVRPTPALEESHRARLFIRAIHASEDAFRQHQVFRRAGERYRVSVGPMLGHIWMTENPLPPGGWVVRIEAEGYRRWEESVVVRGGETTRVKVLLEPE